MIAPAEAENNGLTAREVELLEVFAKGGSYKEAYIKGNGPASPSRSEAPEAVETVVATEEATPLESL